MRNHCRVIITDDCNLSCEFCCMKDKEIYDSFVSSTAMDIAKHGYDEVCITGGEPLLVLPKVIQFASLVRYFTPDVKIYLYTNGELLTRETAQILTSCGINGLNISVHHLRNWGVIPEYCDLHSNIIPVRFLVREKELADEVTSWARISNIPVRIWKMDDCKDMPYEDRYRIDWNRI